MGVDALVAGRVDMEQMSPVGVTLDALDRDDFARQRIGHEHRPGIGIGDAVAAMAQPRNGELLSHGRRRA